MEITLQKKKDNESVYKIYVKTYFFWEDVLVNLFTDKIISWKEKKMQTLIKKAVVKIALDHDWKKIL